jgi:hypothetical protein
MVEPAGKPAAEISRRHGQPLGWSAAGLVNLADSTMLKVSLHIEDTANPSVLLASDRASMMTGPVHSATAGVCTDQPNSTRHIRGQGIGSPSMKRCPSGERRAISRRPQTSGRSEEV